MGKKTDCKHITKQENTDYDASTWLTMIIRDLAYYSQKRKMGMYRSTKVFWPKMLFLCNRKKSRAIFLKKNLLTCRWSLSKNWDVLTHVIDKAMTSEGSDFSKAHCCTQKICCPFCLPPFFILITMLSQTVTYRHTESLLLLFSFAQCPLDC